MDRVYLVYRVRDARRCPGPQLGQRRRPATMITPTTSATIPAACIASWPGVTWIRSPNTMHAEQEAHQRLARRDGRQRLVQRAGVERALHQPDADRARAYQRVRRPGGEHRADPAGLQDLQRLPGQRVLDAEHQARAHPGQQGPGPAPTAAAPRARQGTRSPAITAAAGQCDTEPNDRPIGFADRDADSSATPVHSTAAPSTSQNCERRLGQGHRDHQREDQVRGQQAARRTPATGARSTRPRAPGRRSCTRCPPATAGSAAGR